MACERVGNAIICSRGTRQLGICQECRQAPAVVLCDGPLPRYTSHPSGLCSKPLCRDCATHVDPDRDYCAEHKDPDKRRLAL